MKYYLFKINTKPCRAHNLKKLFACLPEDKKSAIENSLENFTNNLHEYSEYFVNQRYLYETQAAGEISIDVKFLYDFRESLHKITPEIRQIKISTAPKPSPAA
ncbi:hypothetical protein [Limnohabitans sp.]|uniref:hypothetical protein n=1 Tax=Limnohabitans sp. TaxID=1907725 RepID=UPI0025BA2419|nr:hypothetical protein [Limnohabitans sp.]